MTTPFQSLHERSAQALHATTAWQIAQSKLVEQQISTSWATARQALEQSTQAALALAALATPEKVG
jgi:hypothetical protein